MKKILLILLLLFAASVTVSFISAQEVSEIGNVARQYGITYPIAELGSCTNYSTCRTFCEDPINQSVCVAFAKAKGFYKEDTLSQRQEELLQRAKAELGCNDINSCQAICHLQENFDKCDSFARKHGIQGGHREDPGKQELIQKARSILGCDSPESCRAICQQESNRDKCSNFAHDNGLRGGDTRSGPGGCTSEETCKAFCSDPTHFSECSSFGNRQSGNQGFTGPGGCTSEELCRRYCEQNPGRCQFGGEQNREIIEQCFKSSRYWYDGTCNDKPKTDSGGRWGTKDPKVEECFRSGKFWYDGVCNDKPYAKSEEYKNRTEEYAKFCRENPDKCQPGGAAGFTNPEERAHFEEECRRYPERCRPQSGTYPTGYQSFSCSPPQDGCTSGTTWDRGTCTCKQACATGTSWNGRECMKDSSPPNYDPSSACTRTPGCSWNGSSCQCNNQQPSGLSGQSGQVNPEEQCRRDGKCWQEGLCRDCNQSGGGGVRPEEQCSRDGKCWIDNACRDCNIRPPGSSGSGGGGECENHGGHWENGTCVGAVQGANTMVETPIERVWHFITRLFSF